MKIFEIILISTAILFTIAQKVEAKIPACPATAEVQKVLKCDGSTCSAEIGDWSGSAYGADRKLTLTNDPHPMILKLTTKNTHGCAYNTDQTNVTLYLQLKK